MTEYEMAVISFLGETHKATVTDYCLECDSPKSAISYIYWPIGGCHWFQTKSGDNPCIRVRWTTEGKDGRRIQYVKFYTCQRMRDFQKLRETLNYRVDRDDLDNLLMGKDFVLYIPTDNGTMPELFDSMAALEDHVKRTPEQTILHTWIHRWDEDKDKNDFLAQFKED